MTVIDALRHPANPTVAAWVLFMGAATAVGVGGYFHGHLYHEGYADVCAVGRAVSPEPIGSVIVVALLVLWGVLLFAAGALSISVDSLASILIPQSTSFLGFAEHRYDSRAHVIVIAEIAATILTPARACLRLPRRAARDGPMNPDDCSPAFSQ